MRISWATRWDIAWGIFLGLSMYDLMKYIMDSSPEVLRWLASAF